MKRIVVAYDQKRGIGADNDLLWGHGLPADLQRFRALTLGKSVIMGRNTYESIGHALPGRENIVVTGRPLNAADVIAVDSLAAAYRAASGEPCVIGGGSIYQQALPSIDIVYATEVRETFPQATVFFPELGPGWVAQTRELRSANEKNKYDFDFVTYVRNRKYGQGVIERC
ncbi:MAG: dihydrofolate reductase [Candidatus Saccharimonas sp.]